MRNAARLLIALAAVSLAATPAASAHNHSRPRPGATGLANATVLIIRHAEEAESGAGLSPAGQARARAYARYFQPFVLGGTPLRIDTLIAAADSRGSQRSRLTLEPLSHVSGLPIQQPFSNRRVRDLAIWLRQGAPGRTILVAWHHGELPELMAELGFDPSTLLHRNHWPSHVYDWVVALRFDRNGAIMPDACRLVHAPHST